AETRSLLRGVSGTIRVATACHQSYRWLPDLLKHFAGAWPDVEVTVVSDASASPCEWLARRKLDVALVAGEAEPDERLRLTPLFRDELVVLVGRGHPWFSRREVDVRAFASEHVWADDSAFRPDTPLGQALASAGGIRPRKITEVPMTGVVPIDMVRANLGITVLPRWTVEPALAGGELAAVRLGQGGLWLEWSMATRAETPEPALAAFLDALRSFHPRAKRTMRGRGEVSRSASGGDVDRAGRGRRGPSPRSRA
ncbi:MAG: LysR family transcriptional regulator, partial [Labilithrix sp.]|nr:LysR family transcriptional regulator [Labilithrix sp.]